MSNEAQGFHDIRRETDLNEKNLQGVDHLEGLFLVRTSMKLLFHGIYKNT